MNEFLNNFFFGYYPYIAGTVFLAGSVVRFDMSQYTWKTNSSQIMDSSPRFRLGSNLFHIGMIFLFFGHLVGLLMPHAWYDLLWLTPHSKQIMSMIAGGLFGLLALIGGGILLHRRFTNPRVRAHSSQMDIPILVLLYVQLLFGLLTIPFSMQHLDGSLMMVLSEWSQRILTFRSGAADLLIGVPWLYKIHLFLGLTIFLLFPFTRLVHIWSAPWGYISRNYQIVRQRQG